MISKCLPTHQLAKKHKVSHEIFHNSIEWIMRAILPVEERLKNLPFPESSTAVNTENPVEVAIKIPDNVFIGDDITALKVGIWSYEK